MKIAVVTSSNVGTAAHHVPKLAGVQGIEISLVILNTAVQKKNFSFYRKKFKKILKIGVLGALNGIFIRKWYSSKSAQPLDQFCNEQKIPFTRVNGLNGPEIRKVLKEIEVDLAVSLGNGYIAKGTFQIPNLGFINIHHELLPQYRNAQGVIWSIYNSELYTGYTIHKIDSGIDTGEILFTEKVKIAYHSSLEETVGKTSEQLLKSSANGLIYTLSNFEELSKNVQPQSQGRSYTTPNYWQFLRIKRNNNRMFYAQKRID